MYDFGTYINFIRYNELKLAIADFKNRAHNLWICCHKKIVLTDYGWDIIYKFYNVIINAVTDTDDPIGFVNAVN